MAGRAGKASFVLATVVIVVVAGYALWVGAAFHQRPLQQLPDRVSACGREFEHGTVARALGKSDVVQQGASPVTSWWTARGRYQLWASSRCGTVVYVRTPGGQFFGFGLLGGP